MHWLQSLGAAAAAVVAVLTCLRLVGRHTRRHVGRWAAIWALPARVEELSAAVASLTAEMRGTREALSARLAVDEDELYRRMGGQAT